MPACAALLAQQPAAPAGQRPAPTFRVEVNYVEIDATVTDAQGNFVRDLNKDDFELIEEGEAQAITAFTMVDVPVERAGSAALSRHALSSRTSGRTSATSTAA